MGAIYIAGHRIRDHKPFGLLSVSEILSHSSDVGAIKVGLRLGAPRLYSYLRDFGFGSPTGIDLPGESRGLLRRLENWTPVSVGSISMGQEVGVTPVQLTTAVSVIANGGLLYRPHVVEETTRNGRSMPSAQPEPKRVISEKTAATLRQMMQGVVLEGGTGTRARLDGYTVAGKTGTAQKIDPATGRYSLSQYIASFVGFAPINSPAVTIVVALDSPAGLHEGGQVAAPVFKRIAEQVLPYLNVPHDVALPPELERAALRGKKGAAQAASEDDLSDFAPNQLDAGTTEPAAPAAPAGSLLQSAPTVEIAEGEGVKVPDVKGEPVRNVTQECLRLGLSPALVGTGLAVEQVPEAGTLVRRGSRVTVRFVRSTALVPAASRQRK